MFLDSTQFSKQKFDTFLTFQFIDYFCTPFTNCLARVAELVDALVSKTSEVTLVPVRSRPRVRLSSFIYLEELFSVYGFTIGILRILFICFPEVTRLD